MTFVAVLLLALRTAVLAAAPQAVAEGPEPAVLADGPHLVGFRSYVLLDHGRRYRTAFDDGATYGGDGKAPRPVLVNLWYPAEAERAGAPMPHGDYFAVGSARAEGEPTRATTAAVERWSAALSAYAADVACEQVMGRPGSELDEADRALWRRSLERPTRAHRGARAAAGPFPFVVYHSGAGSSFEDNARLCEHLASHGYVVLGSAYQEADGGGLGVDGEGGSVRDMELLARHAAELPFVDWRRCAFGGHSLGAQAVLRAALRPDCPADALFLLDTTVDYYSPAVPSFRYLTEPVLARPEAFDAPMLVVAGHEATFRMCDRLTRADRTYLTLPELGHDEYIAQGLQRLRAQGLQRLRVQGGSRASEPGADADEAAARAAEVERLYAVVCEGVRLFLDAELRDARAPFDAFRDGARANPPGGAEPRVERAPPGTDGPPPWDPESARAPSPRQLQPLLESAGVAGLLGALEAHVDDLPRSPVYSSSMTAASMLYDLAVADRVDDARKVRDWFARRGEDPLSGLRFMALMCRLTGRVDEARALLELALRIVPDDARTLAALRELDAPR